MGKRLVPRQQSRTSPDKRTTPVKGKPKPRGKRKTATAVESESNPPSTSSVPDGTQSDADSGLHLEAQTETQAERLRALQSQSLDKAGTDLRLEEQPTLDSERRNGQKEQDRGEQREAGPSVLLKENLLESDQRTLLPAPPPPLPSPTQSPVKPSLSSHIVMPLKKQKAGYSSPSLVKSSSVDKKPAPEPNSETKSSELEAGPDYRPQRSPSPTPPSASPSPPPAANPLLVTEETDRKKAVNTGRKGSTKPPRVPVAPPAVTVLPLPATKRAASNGGAAQPGPLRPARRKASKREMGVSLSPATTGSASGREGNGAGVGLAPIAGTAVGGEGVVSVRGPTAGDEVRYELLPVAGAPVLSRPALRSSGFVTVVQLAKFIRGQLGIGEGLGVVITCAGEEVSEAMTLHLLVNEVWPKRDGHLVLNYYCSGSGAIC
jgi:hypothetical protein